MSRSTPVPWLRVLVLGGTQFIGRHIVEQLLVVGYHVISLTRGLAPFSTTKE
jgi:2'-hydroxyisoflavone reductase